MSAIENTNPIHRAYWRAHLRVMALCLACWFFVSYGLGILFVERLNAFRLGGFPLGFWFAQQGSIYAFVLLLVVYVLWMDRLQLSTDGIEQAVKALIGSRTVH